MSQSSEVKTKSTASWEYSRAKRVGTLQLDSQLLVLLARARTVRKHFDKTVRNWTWKLDLQGGEIVFMEQGTGRILLSSPVKLVGTENKQAKTFLFSWADPELHEEWGVVSGLGGLRVAARDACLSVFDEPAAFTLTSTTNPSALAHSVAVFLGSSFVFESQERTKVRYLTVEQSTEAVGVSLTGEEVVELIEWATRRYPFTHRTAIYAYLGKPTGAGASTLSEEILYWAMGEATLRVVLDHQGILREIGLEKPTVAEPEPIRVPEPQTKPGLLTRLFGKHR